MNKEEPVALIQQQADEEARGWASVPRDLLWEIIRRLRHVGIIRSAGLACASWRRLVTGEPMLWRSIIDVAFGDDDDCVVDEQALLARLAVARAAVGRSAGRRCESFRGPADRHLLMYLAGRAPSLRSLHVTSAWCLPDAYVDSVITKLPLLERLVLIKGRRPPYIHAARPPRLLNHCPRLGARRWLLRQRQAVALQAVAEVW
ncbi:unnamed protein product [Urochloa humidicola]